MKMERDEKLKKYYKEYYLKNRDKIKETTKKNSAKKYKHDPEKIKNGSKRYYKKHREEILSKEKEYYKENKEYILKRNKKYLDKNQDYIKSIKKIYRENNKEYFKEYFKKYYLNNKDRYTYYQINNKEQIKESNRINSKKKRDIDPLYRISGNIRRMISRAFMRNGYTKKSRTYKILGCDFDYLVSYLELRFEPWMNWGNYGKYSNKVYSIGWDIDHIIPISSASTQEELVKLSHYTNLQPLCSKVNRDIKINKIIF